MLVAVRYHIGVHAYDTRAAQCSPWCLACRLERYVHHSAEDALGAQPPELLEDGRFEVVPLDFTAR